MVMKILILGVFYFESALKITQWCIYVIIGTFYFSIKWPNDIYYAKRVKLGGIILNTNVMGDEMVLNIGNFFLK